MARAPDRRGGPAETHERLIIMAIGSMVRAATIGTAKMARLDRMIECTAATLIGEEDPKVRNVAGDLRRGTAAGIIGAARLGRRVDRQAPRDSIPAVDDLARDTLGPNVVDLVTMDRAVPACTVARNTVAVRMATEVDRDRPGRRSPRIASVAARRVLDPKARWGGIEVVSVAPVLLHEARASANSACVVGCRGAVLSACGVGCRGAVLSACGVPWRAKVQPLGCG